MSRKQWGHGYYTGLKEADAHLGLKRYIAQLHIDGHLQTLYRVLAENGDIFTVENITSDLSILALTNNVELFGISGNDNDIIHENVSEIIGDEKMIYFSSKKACESWCITDYKKWKESLKCQ